MWVLFYTSVTEFYYKCCYVNTVFLIRIFKLESSLILYKIFKVSEFLPLIATFSDTNTSQTQICFSSCEVVLQVLKQIFEMHYKESWIHGTGTWGYSSLDAELRSVQSPCLQPAEVSRNVSTTCWCISLSSQFFHQQTCWGISRSHHPSH